MRNTTLAIALFLAADAQAQGWMLNPADPRGMNPAINPLCDYNPTCAAWRRRDEDRAVVERRLRLMDENRAADDTARQWDNERSSGGYPCMSFEARCRQ